MRCTAKARPTIAADMRAMPAARRHLDAALDLGFAYTGFFSEATHRSFTSDVPFVLIFPGLISSPITTAVGGLALFTGTKAMQHIVDLDAGYDVLSGITSLKLSSGLRFTFFPRPPISASPTPFSQ